MRALATLVMAILSAGCTDPSAPVEAREDAAVGSRDVAAPEPGDPPATGPTLLSETGLYSDFASRTVSPGLFAFATRYDLWSDGAQKARWLYLPPGTKIDNAQMDHWVFPVGTKAFKEFRYAGKLVETRLLMKVRDGTRHDWWQAAYVWKEDGSDAVARLDGVKDALGTGHNVPKQADCTSCHSRVRDGLVGVSAIQLSDPTQNPLGALAAAGRLSTAPPTTIEVPGAGVVKDALAYLHANCGHCHNAESDIQKQTELDLRLLVSHKAPEETGAYTTTVGVRMKHAEESGATEIVVKGAPERSGLWLRMGAGDVTVMPPIGNQTMDPVGLETIRQWIAGWN